MPMFKIVNVTHTVSPQGPGRFLSLAPQNTENKNDHGRLIGAGKSFLLEASSPHALPIEVQNWAKKGWVRIFNAENMEAVGGTPSIDGEIVQGTGSPVRELSAQTADNSHEYDIDEIEPDVTQAREAALPTQQGGKTSFGAHMPDIRQQSSPQTRGKVSLGMETERFDPNVEDQLSPIPGDRPVPVDDSSKFTIRAPRSNQVGSVIK